MCTNGTNKGIKLDKKYSIYYTIYSLCADIFLGSPTWIILNDITAITFYATITSINMSTPSICNVCAFLIVLCFTCMFIYYWKVNSEYIFSVIEWPVQHSLTDVNPSNLKQLGFTPWLNIIQINNCSQFLLFFPKAFKLLWLI